MQRFITVIDKDKADRITAESGYFYVIQKVNGKDVYSFDENEELRELMVGNFDKRDWYVSNKLCF